MMTQRVFDLIFSLTALLVLLPVLLSICAILKLTGEGAIFYLQPRIGKNGKVFKLLKFATMLKRSPELGSRHITLKNDPRILPVGKFLRKTKINELPQLLNVIKGDMSLVGPRPLTPDVFDFYDDKVKACVNSVRPGLSGVGSIVFRHEEDLLINETGSQEQYKNEISVVKGELETWYVSKASLKMYFSVILATLIVLFLKTDNPLKIIYKDIPGLDRRK